MILSRQQRRSAQTIYNLGLKRGLTPRRAQELVAAAYAESGLNPGAVNASSGAAGLFQLLSPGYRERAQQLGGLMNPRANTLAILPDYLQYWQQNPGAALGAAGRDVERSGMGADFYSRNFDEFSFLRAGNPVPTRRQAGTPKPVSGQVKLAKQSLAKALVEQSQQRTRQIGSLGDPFIDRGGDETRLAVTRAINELQVARTTRPQTKKTKQAPNQAMRGKTLLGGKYEMGGGPEAHGSRPLGNWQSDRAWDLMAAEGTPVYAPENGYISKAGFSDNGKTVWGYSVTIGDQIFMTHLGQLAPGIKPGKRVRKGQIIGWIGNSGRFAPHLHIGLRMGDIAKYL
jgi:murein DD-endopeptidase MepM/ murein hydrolase activator NlpD